MLNSLLSELKDIIHEIDETGWKEQKTSEDYSRADELLNRADEIIYSLNDIFRANHIAPI